MRTKALPLFLTLCAAVCFGVCSPTVAQTFPPSVTITYRDLGGNTRTLRAFEGRFVRYALPDRWLEGGGAHGLTPAELTSLLTQADELYRNLTEILAGEPRGEGLLIVAVVPVPAGEAGVQGRAVIGAKVVEVDEGRLAATKAALAAGLLEETFAHEMAHAFSLYHSLLSYYPDAPHMWTELMVPYAQYWAQRWEFRRDPEALLQEAAFNFTVNWDRRASMNSWAQCVRVGGGCESEGVRANRAYAGMLLRYARLHGREAVRRAFEFYRDYKATHDSAFVSSLTPEQKNDLLAEALSFGANLDITPELDRWFWPVSAATREKLRQLYSTPNPFLSDADGDGWTPLQGDLDDRNPEVHPGAVETLNGRDDDCNGFVDDLPKAAGPEFFSPPARLVGRLQSGRTDTFHFEALGPFMIRTRLLTGGATGLVSITHEGEALPTHRFGLSGAAAARAKFTLARRGPWLLTVGFQTGGESDYEIILVPLPAATDATGEVFALPLRPSTSAGARALVPGGLARAAVTLPGAGAIGGDARQDAEGRWPTVLSGFEVRVDGRPSVIVAVRASGSSYTIDFAVPPQVAAPPGARAPLLVRHLPSGAQWSSPELELRASAPALWGRQAEGQIVPTALALESPSLLALDEQRPVPAGAEARVMLFASGMGLGRTADNTRLIAQLPDGRRITLPVEFVGPASLPGISQIVFKADATLIGLPRVLLSVEGEELWVSLPLQ